jgi:hypothetical protein
VVVPGVAEGTYEVYCGAKEGDGYHCREEIRVDLGMRVACRMRRLCAELAPYWSSCAEDGRSGTEDSGGHGRDRQRRTRDVA